MIESGFGAEADNPEVMKKRVNTSNILFANVPHFETHEVHLSVTET